MAEDPHDSSGVGDGQVTPSATGDWRRLQDAFLELIELEPPDRPSALESHDPALRRELIAMLGAHGDEGELEVESCLLGEPDNPFDAMDWSIGPYRVVQELGRGGMGTVYLAHRSDVYEQEVALKIMRWGFGDGELEERFRRERQILARLDHPNIAQLLDGGVSDDGRLYLVMQKVEGLPITAYCDQRRLDIPARLRLFCEVCEAVDFAHRNLIVHRDLKPSNILITEIGGKAQVKLLDFGIAKLLEEEPSDQTRFEVMGTRSEAVDKTRSEAVDKTRSEAVDKTRSEALWMTPEHAAPEQILGRAVTTATDTYALGILLYELLTGERPFSAAGLSRSQLEAVICDRPPTAPSLAVRSHSPAEEVARARSDSPLKLARRLRGDLDTIVARALAKEPERRYGSARGLAEDVQRHLTGLPVLARPDSLPYRLGRFVARHTWQVAAGVALLGLAIAFTVTTVRQSKALERERDEARVERQTAEQVADVLVELFEQANPSHTPDGRKLTVDELLEQHSDQVIQRLEDQPEVQSRLRHMLGRVHFAHSRYDKSRELYQQALAQRRRLAGPDDPLALTVEHDLAVLARELGDRARAEPLLRASLEAHRRVYGEVDESVAQCMQDLAAVLPVDSPEKVELLEAGLVIRRELEPEPSIQTASSLNDLALIDMWHRRLEAAVDRFQEVRAMVERLLGPEHPHALAVKGNLAAALMKSGSFVEARALEEELLEQKRSAYGDESMVVVKALNNLGNSSANLGDWEAAEDKLRRAVETSRKLVGDDHWLTVNSARNLAMVLELSGRPRDALALLDRSAAARLDKEPTEEPFFANQRAALAMRLGKPDQAVRDLRRILDELKELFPEGDYRVAQTQVKLGEALLLMPDEADHRLAREAAEHYRAAYAFQTLDPVRAEAACGLARALARLPEPQAVEEARQLFDDCLGPYQAWGLVHPDTRVAVSRAAEQVLGGADASSSSPTRPDG